MLDEIRDRIEDEIEKLTHELNVELPERISKAVELGDLRDPGAEHGFEFTAADYEAATTAHIEAALSSSEAMGGRALYVISECQ